MKNDHGDTVTVVPRINDQPPYHHSAVVNCCECDEACWQSLGDRTHEQTIMHDAKPICAHCAVLLRGIDDYTRNLLIDYLHLVAWKKQRGGAQSTPPPTRRN